MPERRLWIKLPCGPIADIANEAFSNSEIDAGP
jgi:hypothetical protein